jgi:heme a synthase
MQFWIVLLNAVVGGLTVLARLSPYMVAAHFLAATLLLTVAAVKWDKVQNVDPSQSRPAASLRNRHLSRWLVAVTAGLVVAGTVVTGTGPHAGDSTDVTRMPFNSTAVTIVHSSLAVLALGLAERTVARDPSGGMPQSTSTAWSPIPTEVVNSAPCGGSARVPLSPHIGGVPPHRNETVWWG